MSPGFIADTLVLGHLVFVGFVVLGGALVLWRPWFAWLHLPAAAWGVWITLSHSLCPLTPLENHYRALAGEATYSGGFIAHYVMPVLYPPGLTHRAQFTLGVVLVIGNLLLYGWAWRRRIAARNHESRPA